MFYVGTKEIYYAKLRVMNGLSFFNEWPSIIKYYK